MAYKISKNFTYEEMYASSTAKARGIDNTPNDEVKANLFKLVTTILQPIRDEFGEPVIVGSGYRCPKLNAAVGGVPNSEHMAKNGTAAADIKTKSDTLQDNMRLWKCIDKMIKDKKIKCGQFIFEYGKRNIGPDWIHISLPSSRHTNQYVYIGC